MTERDGAILTGLILGLAVCALLDAIAIAKLRADVQFLTVVSEKALD